MRERLEDTADALPGLDEVGRAERPVGEDPEREPVDDRPDRLYDVEGKRVAGLEVAVEDAEPRVEANRETGQPGQRAPPLIGRGNGIPQLRLREGAFDRQRFGAALLSAHADGYPGAPRSSNVACRVVEAILDWANATALPPGLETRWGEFVGELASSGAFDSPTDEFLALVHDLDDLIEPGGGLGRYLGQITPLAKDLSLTRGDGVRIMTMAGAKGLTVDATIVGGVEEGVVPRPNFDRSEERRLLYVAMTRARSRLFLTWARRRSGPTARAGAPRVGSLRQPSSFLAGGSPASEDGVTYLAARGRRVSASPIS